MVSILKCYSWCLNILYLFKIIFHRLYRENSIRILVKNTNKYFRSYMAIKRNIFLKRCLIHTTFHYILKNFVQKKKKRYQHNALKAHGLELYVCESVIILSGNYYEFLLLFYTSRIGCKPIIHSHTCMQ